MQKCNYFSIKILNGYQIVKSLFFIPILLSIIGINQTIAQNHSSSKVKDVKSIELLFYGGTEDRPEQEDIPHFEDFANLIISRKDRFAIFDKLPLRLSKNRRFLALDWPKSDIKVSTHIRAIDLDRDGVPEVFVSVTEEPATRTGDEYVLYKAKNGVYRKMLSLEGSVATGLIYKKDNKFPEIVSGGPGLTADVYRFDFAKNECRFARSISFENNNHPSYLTFCEYSKFGIKEDFELTNIPKIMRSQTPSWEIAAQLMEDWFSRPAGLGLYYNEPNLSTVHMKWLVHFKSMQTIISEMRDPVCYLSSNAKTNLQLRIREITSDPNSGQKLPYQVGQSIEINCIDFSKDNYQHKYYEDPDRYSNVPYAERYYLTSRSIQFTPNLGHQDVLTPEEYELIGAFGDFNIRIAANFKVTLKENDIFEISVLKLGFFIQDKYDFQGFQYLSCWNQETNEIALTWKPAIVCPGVGSRVTNGDFRDWSRCHERGGDFYLYSDVLTYQTHDTYTVSKNDLLKILVARNDK